MTAKIGERQALSNHLTGRWEQAGAKLADLAREFPEDRYEAAPAAGVRTFGDVLRHIAFWNQYVAQTARGRKADDTANELPQAQCATKAQVIAALTESGGAHHGQLVVYARLAGIVPPASR
jgi:uncharacterized damage-inducible protein DinB